VAAAAATVSKANRACSQIVEDFARACTRRDDAAHHGGPHRTPIVRMFAFSAARDTGLVRGHRHDDDRRHRRKRQTEADTLDDHGEQDLHWAAWAKVKIAEIGDAHEEAGVRTVLLPFSAARVGRHHAKMNMKTLAGSRIRPDLVIAEARSRNRPNAAFAGTRAGTRRPRTCRRPTAGPRIRRPDRGMRIIFMSMSGCVERASTNTHATATRSPRTIRAITRVEPHPSGRLADREDDRDEPDRQEHDADQLSVPGVRTSDSGSRSCAATSA